MYELVYKKEPHAMLKTKTRECIVHAVIWHCHGMRRMWRELCRIYAEIVQQQQQQHEVLTKQSSSIASAIFLCWSAPPLYVGGATVPHAGYWAAVAPKLTWCWATVLLQRAGGARLAACCATAAEAAELRPV